MSHTKVILIVVAAVSLILAPVICADSLQLKNGNFVQGKYLGGTERAVQFAVNGKMHLYDIDEILSISFGSASSDGGGIPSNAASNKSGADRRTNSLMAEDSPSMAPRTRVESGTVRTVEILWKQKPYGSYVNLPANDLHGAIAVCRGQRPSSEAKAGISGPTVTAICKASAVIHD
jgi:hypothetical protein